MGKKKIGSLILATATIASISNKQVFAQTVNSSLVKNNKDIKEKPLNLGVIQEMGIYVNTPNAEPAYEIMSSVLRSRLTGIARQTFIDRNGGLPPGANFSIINGPYISGEGGYLDYAQANTPVGNGRDVVITNGGRFYQYGYRMISNYSGYNFNSTITINAPLPVVIPTSVQVSSDSVNSEIESAIKKEFLNLNENNVELKKLENPNDLTIHYVRSSKNLYYITVTGVGQYIPNQETQGNGAPTFAGQPTTEKLENGQWSYVIDKPIKINYIESNGSAKIKVVNKQTGTPIKNSSVIIGGKTYTTDANGQVEIPALTPGSHSIDVTSANYHGTKTDITVTSDNKTDKTVQLVPDNGSAKITVINHNTNKPMINTPVVINGNKTHTDGNGQVIVPDLTPGSHKITVVIPHTSGGNTTVTVPINGSGAGTINVTPNNGSANRIINVTPSNNGRDIIVGGNTHDKIIINHRQKKTITILPDTGLGSLGEIPDDASGLGEGLLISLIALLGLKKLLRKK